MTYSRYSAKQGNPLWAILEYLQRNGTATIKQLEDVLGVTTTAVRQHLATLQQDGYIQRQRVSTGVGRPHHAYSMTEKCHELFACHCDDLALTLLEEVYALEGAERAMQLLARVGERLAQRYSVSMRATVLQERVQELATALNHKGVLTDVSESTAGTQDDTIILQTYNCPYHELAQEHREVCEMDEQIMRAALGSNVNLTSCMLDGHSSCSFVISGAESTAG